MKTTYASAIRAGTDLTNESFLLQDVVRRLTRDGRPYLLATLRDRTGQVSGVFWDVPDYVNSWLRPGAVVLVSGRANLYREAVQVNITDMNEAEDADMRDLLPASRRSRDEMVAELRQFLASLAEPWQALASRLLLADDALNGYASAPAARGMHHAYVGGLLEHSLSMAQLAEMLAGHYAYVNRDLLLTATLLHDLGKTVEYAVEAPFSYTEDGRLVGHIVRAIIMIETAAAELDFPEEERRQLVHLVASHHGRLEWGSPVVPKTLEAILLHQIDLLDSRVQGFFDHLDSDQSDGPWTGRSDMFGTDLRRPDGYGAGED